MATQAGPEGDSSPRSLVNYSNTRSAVASGPCSSKLWTVQNDDSVDFHPAKRLGFPSTCRPANTTMWRPTGIAACRSCRRAKSLLSSTHSRDPRLFFQAPQSSSHPELFVAVIGHLVPYLAGFADGQGDQLLHDCFVFGFETAKTPSSTTVGGDAPPAYRQRFSLEASDAANGCQPLLSSLLGQHLDETCTRAPRVTD